MTIDLEAIEARAAAATGGPWAYWVRAGHTEHAGRPSGFGLPDTENECSRDIAQFDFDDFGPEEVDANCAFIVEARTDIPALIAEVRRLREALACACELSHGRAKFRTANGVLQAIPEKQERVLRAALGERDAT